jgi:hypothetical protein
VNLASVASLYDRAIVDTGRQAEFLFFVSFLLSWGFIRTSAHMIRAEVSWWPGNVSVGGTHVHHLVWGILALLIFGYVGVVLQPESPWHEIVTVLFGIGAGLTLDEFALWLELKDVYWEAEGRKSIDAVIAAGCLSGIALTGVSAWAELATELRGEVIDILHTSLLLGVVIALLGWVAARHRRHARSLRYASSTE